MYESSRGKRNAIYWVSGATKLPASNLYLNNHGEYSQISQKSIYRYIYHTNEMFKKKKIKERSME